MIEWIDSHSGKGWQPLDEIAETATSPIRCRSVGWLVAQSRESTVIAAHISGGGTLREFGTGDLSIPTKAIVRKTVLRRG